MSSTNSGAPDHPPEPSFEFDPEPMSPWYEELQGLLNWRAFLIVAALLFVALLVGILGPSLLSLVPSSVLASP